MVKKLIDGEWVVLEPVTFHLPSKDVVAYRRAAKSDNRGTESIDLQKLDMFGGE